MESALKAVRSSSVHKDVTGEIDLPNNLSGRTNEVGSEIFLFNLMSIHKVLLR